MKTYRVNGKGRMIGFKSGFSFVIMLCLLGSFSAFGEGINDETPVSNKKRTWHPPMSWPSGNLGGKSNELLAPDPCPIVNGQDAAWACFEGIFQGTTLTAEIGDLQLATVNSAPGSTTTFAPNAIQLWDSGDFSGDEYNGPQLNPGGASGNTTSFDINFNSGVPTDAVILSLNRLSPDGGGTSYTLEAFDDANAKIVINDWQTGQGTDGGVCTNNVNIVYTNGNTTAELQPAVSGDPSCASSSAPIWFRITDNNVSRIEIRKVHTGNDNIHFGLAVVADFGDAPNTYGTAYSATNTPPAFHLLSNTGLNPVFFGAVTDGDGNGAFSSNSNGDDLETGSIGSGDDEDGISVLPDITTADSKYSVTLVCTDGAEVAGWIDFDQSGSFDTGERQSGICASGSITLNWNGLSGLVTGLSHARFRIASASADIADPVGVAFDGEVEDYPLNIVPPPQTDLQLVKTVDQPTPVEGDTVIFSVKLKNNGPDDATGVEVTDQIPSGLTFISASPGQGSYNSSTGIWNIGNIAAGDSVSLVLDVRIDGGTLGQTINNTASVTANDQTDPELANNSATSGITVVQEEADISVAKIVDNNQPIEAEVITFTVTVTNNGPKDATNLTVIDQIPTGFTFESVSVNIGSYNSSNGIWTIGSLADQAVASMTLSVSVDQGTENSTITNTAAVNSVDQLDPNDANNAASVDVDVVEPGIPGQCTEIISLVFQNPTLISGSAGQVGAIYEFQNVTAGVDAEIEIVTIDNASLVAIDQTAFGENDNFQPQVEAVNKNLDNAFIDFEIRFKDASTGNDEFLTFTSSGVDVDGDNVDTREFVGFQRLTSFTVESATNLVLSSEGIFTTFESATSQVVNGIDPQDTDNLVYSTYTNEPQFRIRAGIKDPTNTTGAAAERLFAFNFDPCIINNFNNPTSSNIVDLGVTKSVDKVNPSVGETVTYSLDVTNLQGNAVGNVELTDQIPSGLTFVSATPSQGTYSSGTGTWDIGNLAGQQSVSLTIQATVDNGTEGNTITNTATLTNFTGTDGNQTNNSTSVDLVVFDPGSQLNCTEPPLFSFTNPILEQGVARQVNAVYRFQNVASGLDALVKITGITNATLDVVDDDNLADQTANFSPLFTALGGGNNGFIDWEVTLVQAGTNTPVKRDFALTALDIDGFNAGGGETIRDYFGFGENLGNTVQAGNNLNISTNLGGLQIFESAVTTDGNGTFDINHFAFINSHTKTVSQVRTSSSTTGGFSDDRLVDIDFRQCLDQEFTNPVVTTRDADISVSKTVDNSNPLQDENINFTVSVTNNGPEDATELAINEALPQGLTLVEAAPSQGSYNQLNKIWDIGTLFSGSTATLTLTAAVAQGASSDTLVNTAFVEGFNQFDPDNSNNADSALVTISVSLSGTVFEDITGDAVEDGDMNFADANGDQRAKENVEVHLFRDGGDGAADGGDDVFVTTTTTNNTGEYTFQVGESGDYWIAVDSRTGELSDGSSWAEQTFAPEGGLCTDGAGNVSLLAASGNCYGGRRAAQSDLIPSSPSGTDLNNAEHLTKVTVTSSAVNDVNFGFSFNVVTNTRDGDDDGTANRSIQGSIRQFIRNANVISGANTMRFVPAVAANASGGSGDWWSIVLSGELPSVTDALTTIDGRAFDMNNPLAILDTNTGSVGTGGAVGVNQHTLPTFERKELELNLNDVGPNAFNVNSSGAVTVRRLAIYNGARSLRIQNVSNGLVENNLLGTRADGSDPGGNLRTTRNIQFNSSTALSVLIQRNFIAFARNSGVESNNQNADIEIFNNEIYKNTQNNNGGDGISGVGTWMIEQNLIHENGTANSEPERGGSGIEIGRSTGSSSNNTIRDNSIQSNTVTGINILNTVSASLIEENIINNNGTNYSGTSQKLGAGVKLTMPDGGDINGVRITKNSFFDNHGIGIDIVTTYAGGGDSGKADGVNPNDGTVQSSSAEPNTGIDYPVFTLATIEGSELRIEGFVGTTTSKLSNTFTIEVYKADDDGNNDGLIETGGSLIRPHGEGRELLGVITTNPDGTFSEDIVLDGSVTLVTNDRVTALAFDASGNTSEFSSNQRVVPTGVTISGVVFHDDNTNQIKEGGEPGIEGVTIVLYNIAENNCRSVLTDNNGFYEFTNILNGEYEVIEAFGQSIPTPDVCTPAEADPNEHVSTTPNSRPLLINNLPANQNFGDFEGSKIQGTVFNDNGISGGTANDGIQDGGETGIVNTVVEALSATGTVFDQTSANASGEFTLFVSKTDAPTGTTVKVAETNNDGFITIDGSPGNTGGVYNAVDDEVDFTITTGTVFTGISFADVQSSRFLTDGQQNSLPGATLFFQHTFTAKTSGDAFFSFQSVENPSGINWPKVLYRDMNCNGEIDSGTDQVLSETTALSVVANEQVCLLLRVDVPQGLNDGATSATTITANFELANTNPLIEEVLTRTDLVTVNVTEAGLVITKSVDKAQALPGAPLVYTIDYENNGDAAISSLEVIDETPSFTTFSSASCGTLPNNLTECSITAPAIGSSGTVKWTFTGTLAPGASGTVTYTVIIDN